MTALRFELEAAGGLIYGDPATGGLQSMEPLRTLERRTEPRRRTDKARRAAEAPRRHEVPELLLPVWRKWVMNTSPYPGPDQAIEGRFAYLDFRMPDPLRGIPRPRRITGIDAAGFTAPPHYATEVFRALERELRRPFEEKQRQNEFERRWREEPWPWEPEWKGWEK